MYVLCLVKELVHFKTRRRSVSPIAIGRNPPDFFYSRPANGHQRSNWSNVLRTGPSQDHVNKRSQCHQKVRHRLPTKQQVFHMLRTQTEPTGKERTAWRTSNSETAKQEVCGVANKSAQIQRQEGVCLARDEGSHLMVRPGCPQSSKA